MDFDLLVIGHLHVSWFINLCFLQTFCVKVSVFTAIVSKSKKPIQFGGVRPLLEHLRKFFSASNVIMLTDSGLCSWNDVFGLLRQKFSCWIITLKLSLVFCKQNLQVKNLFIFGLSTLVKFLICHNILSKFRIKIK